LLRGKTKSGEKDPVKTGRKKEGGEPVLVRQRRKGPKRGGGGWS